jgi:predicted TPR repeat methyltransferase
MGLTANDAAADRVGEIYERYAVEWDGDRNGVPWNDKVWHDRFVACLSDGASVLDLGCGSGMPVAQNLVRHGLRVTGVDVAPAMIALCRERLPGQQWIVADMRTARIDRRFDGILGWDSFFFLRPDHQRKMFGVFAAHASSGAFLMFNTGPRHGEAMGRYRGEPLYHASLDPAEYESLLDRSGFKVISHVVEDIDAGGRTVWLARSRA